MNILILAAGETPADSTEPRYPIWLGEVDGELLIERQVAALGRAGPSNVVFVFRRDEDEALHLTSIVEQMVANSKVVLARRDTAGAACSALLAIGEIAMDDELIIASATDQIEVDFAEVVAGFRARGADAGVLTFPSLHPRYSYVRVDGDGFVTEASEKRPISRTASAGLYWFARAGDFFEAAQAIILKDAHVQGRFYICPALNELILKQKKIATHAIPAEKYHPLKSSKQVVDLEHAILEGHAS